MTIPNPVFPIVSVMVICAVFSAACVSTTFGTVAYSDGGLTLSVSHDGAPSEGYVQVTVYEISGDRQQESGTYFAPLNLTPGENTAFITVPLRTGKYKLYLYLIQNGERKAATIRDLAVN
jgi:hypothetical protein